MNPGVAAAYDALPLDGESFLRLAELIERRSGIRMPPTKRTMVEGRLRQRVQALRLDSFKAYCDHLFATSGLDDEIVHLINAVTTNKTEFFREPDHFAYLKDVALPQLLQPGAGRDVPFLKVWSAACACGAEPYTLAMVLDDAARRGPPFHFAVLGTDICTDVLTQARHAVYPEEMLAPVPPEMRRRYFMWSRDRVHRTVRVVPEIRARVRFRHLNLIDPAYPVDRDVDIIFCRNILIYFAPPIQRSVLTRLTGHLRAGGYLFLGHSEPMAANGLALRPVAPTIFRHV